MHLCTGIILAIFVGIISFWLIWRKRKMSILQRYGIPGPKPNFWTGNLKEFALKREKCTVEWMEKYGKFVGFYYGAKPFIMTTDVEFLKVMQVKEFKNFTNKDLILPDAGIPDKAILKALELTNDEEWKNMRSYLSVAFSTGKIKKMSYIMTNAIQVFLNNLKAKNQKTFDILDMLNKLTFDIISKASFGISTDVQNNKTSNFTESVFRFFNSDSTDILPWLSICFPELDPIPTRIRWMIETVRSFLNLTSLRVVTKTCEEIIESRKKSENPPPDLLQSLIEANVAKDDTAVSKVTDNPHKSYTMSKTDVIGNALQFMAAGYDTTSNPLGYCSYHLAKNPEVQERARNEILKHFPVGVEIDYSGLSNLQYLDQIISETHRLHSLTLNSVNRICAEDFKYKDITIPKGVIVAVPLSTLHRDPAYWPDPDKFVPERFAPENRGKIDPFVYQPFGAGPRICIAMRFATTIMKFTLANMIRNYRLEMDENEELELEYTLFFIKPKNGIRLRAIPLT